MTDLIERVAKALWRDRHPEVEPFPSEIDRITYEGHARSAIEAMREPTDAMCDIYVPGTPGFCDEPGDPPEHGDVWQAMIDKALEQ